MTERTGEAGESLQCRSAAAYVLGALPAEERRAFEPHLVSCADCRRSVRELAGLPGLLARVSPADLVDDPVPPPDTLLPRVLHRLRRRRQRRFAGLAAAAAVVVALGAGAVVLTGQDDTSRGEQMTALVSAPLTATADLTPESGGTRIDLTCRYDGATPYDLPAYALVVTGRDGTDHSVATWRVGPDGTSRVVGAVDLAPRDIASVEVRTDTGRAVLRLLRD
jgi:anti-sigma-K factor RskA